MDFELFWDGACSADKILKYVPKGMNGLIVAFTLTERAECYFFYTKEEFSITLK